MSEGGTISIVSGVSAFTGEPFLSVRWGDMAGQLTPDEVRVMAAHWFDAAAAAEHDALLMAELQEAGIEFEVAGALLLSIRKRREQT